jgi:hypothetical protein
LARRRRAPASMPRVRRRHRRTVLFQRARPLGQITPAKAQHRPHPNCNSRGRMEVRRALREGRPR